MPNVTIRLGSKLDKETIKEGSDVYFECIIDANPWITEVFWSFNRGPLFSSTSTGIIISNQSLVIQKISKANRGYYSCSASNAQGIGISEEMFLKVLCKYQINVSKKTASTLSCFTIAFQTVAPVCRSSQEEVYEVAKNELVEITCQVDADPKDVHYKWLLDNTLETGEITSFVSNYTESVAYYVPKYTTSYGKISCWGHNLVGSQKTPCVFHINAAGILSLS